MSGTALSDWALATNSADVTLEVARNVHCPIDRNLADCLRRHLTDTDVAEDSNRYRTKLGPIFDSVVVPNEPRKIMAELYDMFIK